MAKRDYSQSLVVDAIGLRSVIDGLAHDLQELGDRKITPADGLARSSRETAFQRGPAVYGGTRHARARHAIARGKSARDRGQSRMNPTAKRPPPIDHLAGFAPATGRSTGEGGMRPVDGEGGGGLMGKPFMYQGLCIERLRRAHAKVTVIAMDDRDALVIFERLDRELRAAKAMQINDPVAAARQLLAAQNATD